MQPKTSDKLSVIIRLSIMSTDECESMKLLCYDKCIV